ncbi:MAG: hypothetical protein Q9196_003056 [Gyalolechia fulgens]
MITSYNVKRADDKIVNPSGEAYRQSLMERRNQLFGRPINSTINSRMTEGLEEPSASLIYRGHLTSAESCAIVHRPLSREFIKRRFNSYNIAAALHELQKILARKVFVAGNVMIETPYRAQAARYRQAISRACSSPAWAGLDPVDIGVSTIDKVALTRPRCAIIVIADLRVIELTPNEDENLGDPQDDDDDALVEQRKAFEISKKFWESVTNFSRKARWSPLSRIHCLKTSFNLQKW